MSEKVEIMKFKEKIIVSKLFVFLRTTQLQETFWSDKLSTAKLSIAEIDEIFIKIYKVQAVVEPQCEQVC